MYKNATMMAWILVLGACGTDKEPKITDTPVDAPVYELTDDSYTLLQGVWEPLIPPQETVDAIADGSFEVFDIDQYESRGLGVQWAPGVPWVEHDELAPGFVEGTDRRSVAWIWQAADPQIIDEESPIRFEAYDGLYRPGGHLTVQVFEAHVRTAQRINELSSRPYDFAVIAGDLTDGSHLNEMQWFLKSLNGGFIDPDSGADDDPIFGEGNDFNDPFLSDGLDADWYAALGNHETLYNGGFGQLDETTRDAATGAEIYDFPLFANGFRDGALPDAPVVESGTTIADESRLPLRLPEILEMLYRSPGMPKGHGLTWDDVENQRGYFSVQPIEGMPVRLIVLNTVDSNAMIGAGAQGFVDEEQHSWLIAELAASDEDGELIIVMTHHRIKDIGGFSPTTPEDLAATLAASDGLALHITGHGHFNQKSLLEPDPAAGMGFWQLMLASTVDFPMQTRLIEVVDERNGFATIYVTNLDHNSPTDSLAHRSRSLAAGKMAFPDPVGAVQDIGAFWEDELEAQNLILRIELTQKVQNNLAKHQWSKRIESEDTLLTLPTPNVE